VEGTRGGRRRRGDTPAGGGGGVPPHLRRPRWRCCRRRPHRRGHGRRVGSTRRRGGSAAGPPVGRVGCPPLRAGGELAGGGGHWPVGDTTAVQLSRTRMRPLRRGHGPTHLTRTTMTDAALVARRDPLPGFCPPALNRRRRCGGRAARRRRTSTLPPLTPGEEADGPAILGGRRVVSAATLRCHLLVWGYGALGVELFPCPRLYHRSPRWAGDACAVGW